MSYQFTGRLLSEIGEETMSFVYSLGTDPVRWLEAAYHLASKHGISPARLEAADEAILASQSGDASVCPITRLVIRLMNRTSKMRDLTRTIETLRMQVESLQEAQKRSNEHGTEVQTLMDSLKKAESEVDRLRGLLCDSYEQNDKLIVEKIALTKQVDQMLPLAAAEQERQAKAKAKRSAAATKAAKTRAKAQAKHKKSANEAKYQKLLEIATVSGTKMPKVLHKLIAKEIGVTAAYNIVWSADSKETPKEVYRAAYHTTVGGDTIVHHPNSYRYPTTYHCAIRQIHIGLGWYRSNLKTLCRKAIDQGIR